MDSLAELRTDLARRSQWSIGYSAAGFVYWSFAAIVGALQPAASARLYWAVGGCLIFPLAIALSLGWGADPFSRGNALGDLVGLTHASLIWLLMPLIVVFYFRFPDGLPLALAICLGASYPVLGWAFGTRIFLWHIIIRVVAVTGIWFALPEHRYTLLPAFVAAMYLAMTALIPGQRRAWLRSRGMDGA
jgi:Family of unknown function (DUF7010)